MNCDGFYLTFNINEFLYGHIKGDIIENDSIIRTNCSGGGVRIDNHFQLHYNALRIIVN